MIGRVKFTFNIDRHFFIQNILSIGLESMDIGMSEPTIPGIEFE